jgi:putative acetyltransferase
MLVTKEQSNQIDSIYEVNAAAFDTNAEANLVNCLRDNAGQIISLVAVEEGSVIGHILFSPMSLDSNDNILIMGLAPMAVTLEKQNMGVGSALVLNGIDECRALGVDAIFVLGHTNYSGSERV